MKYWPLIVLGLAGCSKESGKLTFVPNTPIEYVAFAGQSNITTPTGLSNAFAEKATGHVIIPIQCAKSGSYLSEWKKGERFYTECVTAMLQNPPKAIIWWQGESDTNSLELAESWGMRFEQMIKDMRQDLGYQIPVIYVRLGGGNDNAAWAEVQRQQETLHVPRSCVQRIDFAEPYRREHDLHYDPMGYDLIGKALAVQYLELFDTPMPHA